MVLKPFQGQCSLRTRCISPNSIEKLHILPHKLKLPRCIYCTVLGLRANMILVKGPSLDTSLSSWTSFCFQLGHCANLFSWVFAGLEGRKGIQDCICLIQGWINKCYKWHLELVHFKKCALFQSVMLNALLIITTFSNERGNRFDPVIDFNWFLLWTVPKKTGPWFQWDHLKSVLVAV